MSFLPRRRPGRDASVGALTPPAADRRVLPLNAATRSFLPGTVFATRYRMVARLGYGGLGEIWRAEDLVLQTPVALKLIDPTDQETRERVLNEARLAREITHPAVRRIFDVGEADGEVFCSMELIEGEDLATLLRRVGRLPVEKVLDIGRQLSAGLAAAHERGVLHRDLTLANVLIDGDGAVRIIDFGMTTQTANGIGMPMGGGSYPAPEQLVPGGEITERTDLYALGIVLYELLVGARPSTDETGKSHGPVKPSALIPGVNARFERVILKALAQDPRRRPASAAAMGTALADISLRKGGSSLRAWVAGLGLAAVVAALAVLSTRLVSRGNHPLTAQDRIVLADFMNTTGEPVFDGALKVALAVALEQSPFLRVFPDDRVRETLRLMQHAPDEPVSRSVAREVARREQLKALVAGSIGSLGSHYVLALEALNAETGEAMAREQLEIAAKEQVLTGLGEATSRLREKLGESLGSIQRFDVPLPRATTASLAALHAYSLALDQGRESPRLEAIPHLKRALELDPNFALALAFMSGVYTNTSHFAEAPTYSRRAFALRDRVSERERFFISWRYYVDAEQAWDKALDLGESWTQTYPLEALAFNSLGLASGAFGQHQRAITAFREAIRLDAKLVPPYRNLVGSLISLDRFDEARSALREASAKGIDSVGLRQMARQLEFIGGNSQPGTVQASQGAATQDAMWTFNSEARTRMFAGRFNAAHDLFERGVQLAIRNDFKDLGAQWTIEDAEGHAIVGECDRARREVAAGLALARSNFALERAGRALALCDAGGEASKLSGELAERFSTATLTMRLQRPIIEAAIALRRGTPERALEVLEPVKPYDQAPAAEFWPAYLRGLAYLQTKDGRAAGLQFQSILDHRGYDATSPLYVLAHLGLGRAAGLAGDTTLARRAYETFFTLWKGADAGLQPMLQARAEYARLPTPSR